MRIKRGNPREILRLFSKMPKDEKFANLLEDIIEEMRRELRLHKLEVENLKYEYRCPYCGYVNERNEPTARIVCTRCKRVFRPSFHLTGR